MGIIGTELLAVPVLAGSAALAVAEYFRWRRSGSDAIAVCSTKDKAPRGSWGFAVSPHFYGLFTLCHHNVCRCIMTGAKVEL